VQQPTNNLTPDRRVRRAAFLLCLSWLLSICSQATATSVNDFAYDSIRPTNSHEKHSWALLSGSHSSHALLVCSDSKPSQHPLSVLKFFVLSEGHTIQRGNFVQSKCVPVACGPAPKHTFILPGIPPPSLSV